MEFPEVRSIVQGSWNIVFFGGAGTSTESGIPDFRSAGGLFQTVSQGKISPEEVLSRSFFQKHPEEFFDFYRNRMIYPDALPNAAHRALAELEKQGKLRAVITQNIDGLHQVAGSRNVLELHGSIRRNHCMDCRQSYSLDELLASSRGVPRCSRCGGIIKPDVVLYQESLDPEVLDQSVDAVSQADVLIVAGTSLSVYPAAGLVRYYNGDKLILINKSSTAYDRYANILISDSIGKVMESLI